MPPIKVVDTELYEGLRDEVKDLNVSAEMYSPYLEVKKFKAIVADLPQNKEVATGSVNKKLV